MSADVFVLPSPTPTLYAFPSQLHPSPPASTGGAPGRDFRPYQPFPFEPVRPDDEIRLAVLGAI